jgi:sugar/nucleoside kinase (ribokinase family)
MITDKFHVKCPAASNEEVFKEYKIVDTVGAGDCFTGAFAAKHAELDWSDSSKSE